MSDHSEFRPSKLGEISRPRQWPTISQEVMREAGLHPVYGANGVIGFYNSYTHERPTVAITCRGSTCGEIHLTPEKSYITGNAMALDDLDRSRLDQRYLYHFLKRDGLKDCITGSAQPQIIGSALKDFLVWHPPLESQRTIAAILDTLDTQIQKTEALIAKLEKVKEGLLHDLLTRGIDENGQLRPSPEQAPELYKDSPLGTIPREWTSQRLGEVVSFKGGVGFPERAQGKKHGDFPFYKVSDMSIPGNEKLMRKANNYVTNSVAKGLGATPIAPRSVVFAKVGAALLLNRRRLLSTSSLLDNNMMAATATMGVHPEFLYWWMTRVDFGLLVQPGALPSINQSQMEKITIGLPPETEQRLISSRLETHDALIENKKRELPILNSLKSGLMDDLLTGRVRVTPLLEQAQAQGTTPA